MTIPKPINSHEVQCSLIQIKKESSIKGSENLMLKVTKNFALTEYLHVTRH